MRGETYEGPLHAPTEDDSSIYSAPMQDFFYFLVNTEHSIVLIAELVLVSLHSFYHCISMFVVTDQLNRVAREVSLGWTVIPITDATGLKDVYNCEKESLFTELKSDPVCYLSACFYISFSASFTLVELWNTMRINHFK